MGRRRSTESIVPAETEARPLAPRGWILIAIGVGLLCTLVAGIDLKSTPWWSLASTYGWSHELTTGFLPSLIAGLPTGVQGAVLVAILWYSLESHEMRKELALQNKIALYERRFSVFRASRAYLADVVANGRVDMSAAFEFLRETAHAEFLLDCEIDAHMREIYRKSVEMFGLQEQVKALPDGPSQQRVAIEGKRLDIVQWMLKQEPTITQQFRRYLRIP